MKKTGANNTRGSRSANNVRSTSSRASGTVSNTRSKAASGRTAASSKTTTKKKKNSPWVPVAICASVLLIGGVAGAYLWKTGFFDTKYDLTNADGTTIQMTEDELRASLSSDTFLSGIIINGIDVSGMTKEAALAAVVANEPEAPLTIDVSLNLDDQILPLDLSSLPITSNANEVVDTAFSYLKVNGDEDVNTLIDIYAQREALKATPMCFSTAYTLHSDDIASIVHGVLDSYQHPAVEAEITGFDVENCQFEYTPSEEGYVVDIDQAVVDVKALLDSSTYVGVVDVNAQVEEPSFTTEMIATEFGRISSSSSVTTSNSNRNHNITITAERINGLVLQPGESFSFNGFIGQRTAASGYLEAGVIVNGKTESDFGGGICQVTSMIYQSVIKADLQVDERNPHMWPSSYADPGTDAAVDWPSQDFAFTNNSEYAIVLVANWNPSNSKITVEIYGHLFPNGEYYGFEGQTTSVSPARTEYVQNTTLPVGQTNQIRSSHDGRVAASWQIRYDANGNEISRVEMAPTHYSTINAQIEVGTLQPDGTQAAFDASTGTIVTTATEAPTVPSDTTPTQSETVPAPSETEPAPVETTPPPQEGT